jgi:hypothetical protein
MNKCIAAAANRALEMTGDAQPNGASARRRVASTDLQ